MSRDDGRPAALLTNAQRAYLRGEREDYSPSAERDVKQRIRNRLRASIDDISLIIESMPLEEIEKAIENTTSDWSDMVALVVIVDEFLPGHELGVQAADPPAEPEATIGHGIKTGLRKLGQTWEDIVVTIERGDPIDVLAQKDLSNVSHNSLDHLLAVGLISREEYATEILRRKEDTMDMEQVGAMRRDAAGEEDGDGQE